MNEIYEHAHSHIRVQKVSRLVPETPFHCTILFQVDSIGLEIADKLRESLSLFCATRPRDDAGNWCPYRPIPNVENAIGKVEAHWSSWLHACSGWPMKHLVELWLYVTCDERLQDQVLAWFMDAIKDLPVVKPENRTNYMNDGSGGVKW